MDHPRRVLVVGPPGSGKTWVADRAARAWELRHIELDSLKLRPNRELAPPDTVEAALEAVVMQTAWLLDGNWDEGRLAQVAWERADIVIQLDRPRLLVLWQVVRRSLRRLASRENYYGWDERVSDWFSPTHPLRWSWTMATPYRQRYERLATAYGPRRLIVLRTTHDARDFIRSLTS